jgi:hypothetical protein
LIILQMKNKFPRRSNREINRPNRERNRRNREAPGNAKRGKIVTAADDDRRDARLVERVDQDVEASGRVALFGAEPRDRLDDDRREAIDDREVVGGEPCCAELGEENQAATRPGPGTESERPLTRSVALSPGVPSVTSAKALSSPSCAAAALPRLGSGG